MRRGHSRAIVRCAVILLAAYLVVDTATPLLPGAFRFDPTESVEASGRPGLPTVALARVTRSDRVIVTPDAVRAALRSRHVSPVVPRIAPVPRLPGAEEASGVSEDG